MSKELFTKDSDNKISMDFMKDQITDVSYNVLSEKKLTHCALTVKNGFTFTGESACVDTSNYNQEIGEKIAYDNAVDKMWPAYGFALAQHLYESK